MEDEGLEFVIAGNIAGLRELGNTGEPFVIMSYNSPEIDFVGTVVMSMWHLFDEPSPPTGSVSIAIYDVSETVHKLDPKFLPEALQFGVKPVLGDIITWDGNTNGYDIVEVEGSVGVHEGGLYVRVSDAIVTDEDIGKSVDVWEDPTNGIEIGYQDSGNFCTHYTGRSDELQYDAEFGEGYMSFVKGIGPVCCIVFKDNTVVENVTFPKAGVYFYKNDAFCVNSLFINKIGKFDNGNTTPLDKKHLPTSALVLYEVVFES
jgi:hypothetical protein